MRHSITSKNFITCTVALLQKRLPAAEISSRARDVIYLLNTRRWGQAPRPPLYDGNFRLRFSDFSGSIIAFLILVLLTLIFTELATPERILARGYL